MASTSRVHPSLTERQGPPSTSPAPEAGRSTPQPPFGSTVEPTAESHASSLPYPPANSTSGQPSFPAIPKDEHLNVATLQVPQPAGPQRLPSIPPPAYNSVSPAPPMYGYPPGYSAPVGTAQYPIGYQPYYFPQQPQQTVIIGQSTGPAPTYIRTSRANTDEAIGAIVLSCFAIWCCGCVFGLIAFILAIVACNKVNDGKSAHRLSVASYVVSGVGIGVAILALIISLSVAFGSSTSSSSCQYKMNGICYSSRSTTMTSSDCSVAGGYFSYSNYYCYLESDNYQSCSGYYVSAVSKCYNYRSSYETYSSCISLGGYYSSTYGYCYYMSSCSYYYGSQCYRYSSSSLPYSSCSSKGGYYTFSTCYYN